MFTTVKCPPFFSVRIGMRGLWTRLNKKNKPPCILSFLNASKYSVDIQYGCDANVLDVFP